MYTINKNVEKKLIICSSRFIAILYKIESRENVKKYLDETKSLYKGASQYPYAFILDSLEFATDDGEPGKTAGIPILNALKKEDLNHVLCVVVRYFGGKKLGTGGLIRAYRDVVNMAISISSKEKYIKKEIYELVFDYSLEKEVLKIISTCDIINKNYDEKVTYVLNISAALHKRLLDLIKK